MIPLSVPEIRGNEWNYVKDCIDTGWVSTAGKYVDQFESAFASYLDVNHAVAVNSGTTALHLALLAAGIGSGDEVIVPSMTFIAPVNAVRYVGAKPVFVDIAPDTWVMDADLARERITTRTRAIIPVHIYGNFVEMKEITAIAEEFDLTVIEDATEALGTAYKEKKAGTFGHMGCFSFNGNKLITTGAGGMLVTNDERLATRAKYLSTQAKTILPNGGFYHEETGYNWRMPSLNAAFGLAQLENVDKYIEAKKEIARLYNLWLKGLTGLILPSERQSVRHSHWLYSVLVEDDFPCTRDELIQYLFQNGIITRPFFQPVHLMPPYSTGEELPFTLRAARKGINLPSSVGLKEQEIQYVCQLISQVDRIHGRK